MRTRAVIDKRYDSEGMGINLLFVLVYFSMRRSYSETCSHCIVRWCCRLLSQCMTVVYGSLGSHQCGNALQFTKRPSTLNAI